MTSDLTRLPVSIGGAPIVINQNEQVIKGDFENKTDVSLTLSDEGCGNGRNETDVALILIK